MRRAADGGVHLAHLVGHLYAVAEKLTQVVASALQSALVLLASVDDVELRTARLALRIHHIRLACSRQSATLVVNLRQTNLRRNGIVERVVAEHSSLRSILAIRVASLNHEVGYDTVEQQRVVVVVLAYELKEVVTMQRRLVIQRHPNIAHRRLNEHLRSLLCLHSRYFAHVLRSLDGCSRFVHVLRCLRTDGAANQEHRNNQHYILHMSISYIYRLYI